MSFDDFILEMKFFLPSEALTREVVALNQYFLRAQETDSERGSHPVTNVVRWRPKRIKEPQRLIAERLYRYFASVARNSKDPEAVVFIWDCIPHGMSVPLGFPPYAEIEAGTEPGIRAIAALRELTTEFRSWLKHRGIYQAPWGELEMIDEDRLQITDHENDRVCPEPVRVHAAYGMVDSTDDDWSAVTTGPR